VGASPLCGANMEGPDGEPPLRFYLYNGPNRSRSTSVSLACPIRLDRTRVSRAANPRTSCDF
jgi:hypothetical protein